MSAEPDTPMRGMHRLIAAEAVSNFGSMLTRLAIPWIATLTLAANPLEMGLLRVADVVAATLGALWLGAWIDRGGKRRTMLLADAGRAALMSLLAFAAWSGHAALWVLFGVAAASGVLTAGFDLARSAWMAQSVRGHALTIGNARIAAASSIAETTAFALGGWLYQGLGAAVALGTDAMSYILSALFVRGVAETESGDAARRPHPGRPAGDDASAAVSSLLRDVLHGMQALWATRALRSIAVVETLVALGLSVAATSYMIFVVRDLAFATGILGLIFGVGGAGALAGAMLAPRLGRALGHGSALTLGLALLAAGSLLVPLAQGAAFAAAALLVAHQLIADAGHAAYEIHDRTLRQTLVAPALVARVDASIRTLGQIATLIGALGGGAIATEVGERAALVLSAALFAAACVVAFAGLRHVGPSPQGEAIPAPAVADTTSLTALP